MNRATMKRASLFLVSALLAGCGLRAPAGPPKLPPSPAAALEEFHAAMRLARLGPSSWPRALERLEAARRIDPHLWEAWYDAGWILEASHRPEEAAQAYEHALSIDPAEPKVTQALASVYLAERRFADAERTVRAELARPELPAEAAQALEIQLAAALRGQGQLDPATEELRKVLRAQPRSAAALGELGLVYEAHGQHELAELVLRRALEVAPKKSRTEAAVWNDLGLVLLSLRRDQEAFAAFEKAAADPTLTQARYNRAAVYLDCGDYRSAAHELERLVAAQPDLIDAWVALGVAERGAGKLPAAEAAYQHALALDANEPEALYNTGVLRMDFKRDPQGARGYFERFIAADRGRHPAQRADAQKRLADLGPAAPAVAPKGKAGK